MHTLLLPICFVPPVKLPALEGEVILLYFLSVPSPLLFGEQLLGSIQFPICSWYKRNMVEAQVTSQFLLVTPQLRKFYFPFLHCFLWIKSCFFTPCLQLLGCVVPLSPMLVESYSQKRVSAAVWEKLWENWVGCLTLKTGRRRVVCITFQLSNWGRNIIYV